MKRIVMVFTVALVMVAMSMLAFAAITFQNPGGQSPQGNCQGANENVNPAGHARRGRTPKNNDRTKSKGPFGQSLLLQKAEC